MLLDQVLQIRITKDERKALAEIAEKEERSLSHVIRSALRREIEYHRNAHVKRGEQADSIRRHCRDNFIDPARARGAREVAIRVGEIGRAMELTDRPAAIVSAIGADKFLSYANVERVAVTGPQVGMSTRFVFRLK